MIPVKKNRKGIALAGVLGFCIAILAFAAVMHFNMKTKTHTQKRHYEDARALWAATSAIQLALYKYRVLPAEYYYIQELEYKKRRQEASPQELDLLKDAKKVWLEDLNSLSEGSVAAIICANLDAITKAEEGSYAFQIQKFDLVSNEDYGYVKDFLRVRAMGRYKDTQRVLEDMVEVTLAR